MKIGLVFMDGLKMNNGPKTPDITLRDYFAGQAMIAVADLFPAYVKQGSTVDSEFFASLCWRISYAMMRERNKRISEGE